MAVGRSQRSVPLTAKLQLYVGGIFAQMGWFFFGFGLIFFWVFCLNADLSFIFFRGTILNAQGVVTDARDTRAEVGEQEVVEVHYEFKLPDGRTIVDFSYATGKWPAEGSRVIIEYPERDPMYSRIVGMRREMFGPWVLIVSIFPLVGLAMIYFGMSGARQKAKLLKQGILTEAHKKGKVPTNVSVNDRTIYNITWAITDLKGREHRITTKSEPFVAGSEDMVERALYLPDNPQEAVIVDALRPEINLDREGRVVTDFSGKSWLKLLAPGITIIGHGLYVVFGLIL